MNFNNRLLLHIILLGIFTGQAYAMELPALSNNNGAPTTLATLKENDEQHNLGTLNTLPPEIIKEILFFCINWDNNNTSLQTAFANINRLCKTNKNLYNFIIKNIFKDPSVENLLTNIEIFRPLKNYKEYCLANIKNTRQKSIVKELSALCCAAYKRDASFFDKILPKIAKYKKFDLLTQPSLIKPIEDNYLASFQLTYLDEYLLELLRKHETLLNDEIVVKILTKHFDYGSKLSAITVLKILLEKEHFLNSSIICIKKCSCEDLMQVKQALIDHNFSQEFIKNLAQEYHKCTTCTFD